MRQCDGYGAGMQAFYLREAQTGESLARKLPHVIFRAWAMICASTNHAASLIVDSFEQGELERQFPNLNFVEEDVSLPLGNIRRVSYSGNESQISGAQFGISPQFEKLHFYISGTSSQNYYFPLTLSLAYRDQNLHSIAAYSAFILGFSQITGLGDLYIELGSTDTPSVLVRLPLNAAGEYHYPVSDVYANPGHTLEAFSVLRFGFEARSPEFSFTLEEIRLVPEPSATFSAALAGMLLTLRRRRAVS